MPLKKGRGKKTISENIREFHGGKTYAATSKKFGKEKANKQAIAAAMRTAGKSKRRKGTKTERNMTKGLDTDGSWV